MGDNYFSEELFMIFKQYLKTLDKNMALSEAIEKFESLLEKDVAEIQHPASGIVTVEDFLKA